jgi:hypothetical protein
MYLFVPPIINIGAHLREFKPASSLALLFERITKSCGTGEWRVILTMTSKNLDIESEMNGTGVLQLERRNQNGLEVEIWRCEHFFSQLK